MTADPYETFLSSTDVPTWQASLHELLRRLNAATDRHVRLRLLSQAVTVSGYLSWLSRVAGKPAAQRTAEDAQALLRDRLAAEGQPATAELRAVWGQILCWNGFTRLGRSLLTEAGELPTEYTVLGPDQPPVQRLARLRERVERRGGHTFLPLVFQYTLELVEIGAVHEARSVLTAPGIDQSSPLVLDLLGKIDERQGQWEAALARYRCSSWPDHRHRAAMLGIIVRSGDSGGPHLELDKPTLEVLQGTDGELDQAELARCSAFLNACLWQPMDDWLIDLELGKLAFRRRHHFEADHHLRRSMSRAPAGAGFAIASLASTNLSWVLGISLFQGVSLVPEAVTLSEEALTLAGEEDDARTASIAAWLAAETGDIKYVAAPGANWPDEDRARAQEARGEKATAIETSLTGYARTGNHRSAMRLVGELAAAQFTRAAGYLVDLVLSENSQDPLALLETAETVLDVGLDTRTTGADGTDYATALFERMLSLGRFEFKDLVRACDLAAKHQRTDDAEDLLLLAGSRAESSSELLELAILQRRLREERPDDIDRENTVAVLDRVLRQSRDRFERLQVAREYDFHGEHQRAQTILEEEGVWATDTDLSHAELTVALQCRITPEERRQLGERATRHLATDHEAGRLGTHPHLYAERLCEVLQATDFPIEEALARYRSRPRTETPASGWISHVEELDAALEDTTVDLGAVVTSASSARSFGHRLATIAHLRQKVDDLMLSYGKLTPEIVTDDPPVSRAYDNGDSPRALELSELWWAFLDSGDDRTADRLHAFFEEEKTLVARWEAHRKEVLAPLRDRLVRASDVLRTLAENLIGPEQEREPHPILTGLYASLRADVTRLLSDLRADRAELESEEEHHA
ncbi:hypothetical protein [Streptomyces torulosus]|uniref:hypothetical protein n=1 Tax=Streptomyces torulosus TaxID=68276 RepID=UPI000AFD415B|nr:hypothetical protein [Streptomyces torulosus]